MLGARVNSFTESSIGESENDANSALTELDKGLRSGKVGEQCESIVRFPRLFEKYPFPILINASFLKLADVFRVGNNFLRLCVLRVCQQSEKHLDKVYMVDEFVRRVYSVIHSNDPIARALTLRTFGAVACLIPERQQVHHSIRTSLDSHDNVEVEASIYAATQFAAQSKSFAISMCNKIADMIQGQATPANMKLQLIPVLAHMHHDTGTSAMVRTLCTDLLPTYPTEEFVLVTLHTLTRLAAATLVDIPAQVSLLVRYVATDPRKKLKAECLQHLHELAKPGAHLWPPAALDAVFDIATSATSPKLLGLALSVVEVLAGSPQLCQEHRNQSKLRQLCSKHCYSLHPAIVAQAIHILTQIICHCHKENLKVTGTDDLTSSLETLIMLLTVSDEKHPRQLKLVLRCAVKLSEIDRNLCERFVDLLKTRLGNVDSDCTIVIAETLGAIAGRQPDALLPHLCDILALVARESSAPAADAQREQRAKILVLLCTLVFQAMCGYEWRADALETLRRAAGAGAADLWACYRVGRAAMRYGHHGLAARVFADLAERVSYEHWHFWLVCLQEMCQAEDMLVAPADRAATAGAPRRIVDRLDYAVLRYSKAIAALKAASTPTHTLHFQAEYMHIRCEFLQCLLLLVHTCNILCVVPPPAIASTIAQSTRDDLQRHGYITNQMRKCVAAFAQCAELYGRLYRTAFDADGSTLSNLEILQQMCVVSEQCVESVCVSNAATRPMMQSPAGKDCSLESRQLLNGLQSAARLCQNISDENLGLTITHKHVDLLKSIVEIFSNAPLPVPRFFFQVLQCTTLKLAVSPQPRVLGECISVQAGSQLAVKVEGVIQHASRPGMFRRVDGVLLAVTSQLQPSAKIKDLCLDNKNVETTCVLSQTVAPHKDFFSAQFLLAFPRGGLYVLTIDAAVVDEGGNTWSTGPKSTLTVKVPEEPKLQPISMPGTGTGNAILMQEDTMFVRKK